MSLGTVLLILLIIALVAAMPTWGYSRGWGYRPASGVALLVLVVLLLLIFGYV